MIFFHIFFHIFTILAGLVSIAGLVKANPILLSIIGSSSEHGSVLTETILNYITPTSPRTTDVVKTWTVFQNPSGFLSATATTLPQQIAADGVHKEAKCQDETDCCIIDFTHVPCSEHKNPICDEYSCGPVPLTIGFSYASPPSPFLGLGPPVSPSVGCVEVLDKLGKDTVYDQFFISHCTKNVEGIELYSQPGCKGDFSSQKNIHGCYNSTSERGIRSFKVIHHSASTKKYLLGGALLNESDPLSTSAYASQGNKASVTPADDCFDKETGAYILGCKVARAEESVVAVADTDDVAETVGLPKCPLMTGKYQRCRLEFEPLGPVIVGRCEVGNGHMTTLSPLRLYIVCPPIMDRSINGSDHKIPECPVELPKDCKLFPTSTGTSPIPLHGEPSLCTKRGDNGQLSGWILTPAANGASASSTGVLAARDSVPASCKDPDFCMNINFGSSMCDLPIPGYPTVNVNDGGTFECRNTPKYLNLQQFLVTYMNSLDHDHSQTNGGLVICNAAGCTGRNQTVSGKPFYTTVATGWGRILSYRVWLDGACSESIGPCDITAPETPPKRGINSGNINAEDHRRAPEPSKITGITTGEVFSITFPGIYTGLVSVDFLSTTTETHKGVVETISEQGSVLLGSSSSTHTGVHSRSKITSKVPASAASTATVSF